MQQPREFTKIEDLTRGRWREILAHCGLDTRYMTGKQGPCPICGGKDRFRFDNKNGDGTFYCNQCGAGRGTRMVMLLGDLSFKDACFKIKSILPETYEMPKIARPDRDPDEVNDRAQALWRSGLGVANTLAEIYLRSRCLGAPWPRALRFDHAVRYDGEYGSFPCLLAEVSTEGGKFGTLHRTYLTIKNDFAIKAPVPSPRKLFAGGFPEGGAVRLYPFEEHLGVAEGIETAMSCHIMESLPVWATVTANGMAAWKWPEQTRAITIFGDNDATFTGHQAAYTLAYRAKRAGLAVQVKIPDTMGTDWNDVLMGKYR